MRNKPLPVEEKEYNRIHASARVVAEHAICRIKKYRIMSDVFRNRMKKYNIVSNVVSGLVNYKIVLPAVVKQEEKGLRISLTLPNYTRDLVSVNLVFFVMTHVSRMVK